MNSIKINENITVNLIPMTKLKTVSVGVYIHRPLRIKEASLNALLPMVLKSGSRTLQTREDIAKYLDNLYGASMGATVIKLGEDQVMYFDAETISDKYTPDGEKPFGDLLRMLMSIIFDPKTENGAFDKEIVEHEKKDAIDRIDAFVNDKRQYASIRCQQETARGTNYAISRIGNKEEIQEITAKSLYDYYKSIITSSVIDIYVCGDVDLGDAEDVVRSYTECMAFKKAEIPKTSIIERKGTQINNVEEKMDVAQGKLAMGFLTNIAANDKDKYALSVFNSVFGAGTHSKLFNNVREKLSLAYYASSAIEKYKGMLIVNAGIEFENFQKAYDEVLIQLDEIRKGNVSEHEFNSSIITIVNAYNSYYDDQRALSTFYLSGSVAESDETLEEYIENIKKVTVEDVVRIANKIQIDTVYFLKGKEKK